MEIQFGPLKDSINRDKHGISLAEAEWIEWNTTIVWPDNRKNYGEKRMVGLGYIRNRLYCVVFVDRDNQRRIISLRKANKREIKRYAET